MGNGRLGNEVGRQRIGGRIHEGAGDAKHHQNAEDGRSRPWGSTG